MRGAWSLLAVLAYPLVSHLAATAEYPGLALAWLGLLLTLAAPGGPGARVLFLALGFACLGLALVGGGAVGSIALRIPPIAIALGLALLFGQTLRPGQVPLIVRIGQRISGPLPARVADYGRALTRFWTWLFLALALESLLLALFASAFWWSLFTNLINYLIVLGALAGEYPVRRRVLSDQTHPAFLQYLRDVRRTGLRAPG